MSTFFCFFFHCFSIINFFVQAYYFFLIQNLLCLYLSRDILFFLIPYPWFLSSYRTIDTLSFPWYVFFLQPWRSFIFYSLFLHQWRLFLSLYIRTISFFIHGHFFFHYYSWHTIFFFIHDCYFILIPLLLFLSLSKAIIYFSFYYYILHPWQLFLSLYIRTISFLFLAFHSDYLFFPGS